MPEVKLSRADKRAIFEAIHAYQPAEAVAARFNVTPRYVRKLYRDAMASQDAEYSFLPCWQCGTETDGKDIFCSSACEKLYKEARPQLYSREEIDSIPDFDLLDEQA